MGMRRTCDVYGTVKGVEQYIVTVTKSQPAVGEEGAATVFRRETDLSPRAVRRLTESIDKLTHRNTWIPDQPDVDPAAPADVLEI